MSHFAPQVPAAVTVRKIFARPSAARHSALVAVPDNGEVRCVRRRRGAVVVEPVSFKAPGDLPRQDERLRERKLLRRALRNDSHWNDWKDGAHAAIEILRPMTARVSHYSTRPFADELPLLLSERRMSLRALATRLDLDHGFLSRAVRGADGKVLTLELMRRIASELSVPASHFAEVREALVIEQIRSDGGLRDRLHTDLNL
jgi:hypothetical protein